MIDFKTVKKILVCGYKSEILRFAQNDICLKEAEGR